MNDDAQQPNGDEEWRSLSLKLLRFAYGQAKTKLLAQACSPEDAVQQAMLLFLKGERKWSPENCGFAQFMRGVIMSIMSSKGLTGMKADKNIDVAYEQDDLKNIPDERANGVADNDKEKAFETLLACIGDDKELQDLVAALQMGYEKTAEIAEIMQIQPQRVSELKRKLDRYKAKAASVFKEKTGGAKS